MPISSIELPTVGFIFETEPRKENRCSPRALDGGGGGRERGGEIERERKKNASLSGGYLGLGFGQRSGY